jgi:hypothetical protein
MAVDFPRLWAVVPRQAGLVQPIQLATYADHEDTSDGKPIVVYHLISTIGTS